MERIFSADVTFHDPEGTLAWMRWDACMLARDFPAAEEAIDMFPFETLPSVLGAPVPKSYLKGCIALAKGENVRAQPFDGPQRIHIGHLWPEPFAHWV